jgi:hypothetical protein
MKALVQEAYAAGGKPFIHIFDYTVEGPWSREPTTPTWRRSPPMSWRA